MKKRKIHITLLFLLFSLVVLLFAHPLSSRAAEQEKEIPVVTQTKTISIPKPSLENRGTGEQVQTFSTSTYTGKYGDQLTGKAASLYKEMVKNYYTNKKTGNFKLANKLIFTFKATISYGYISDNAAYEAAIDSASKIFVYARDAFFEDYPEVFWIYNFNVNTEINAYRDSSYSTGYRGVITVSTFSPIEFFKGASKLISSYDKGVNAAVKEIKASINNSTNQLKIYKAIHDYVCNRVNYDDMAVIVPDDYLYAYTSANAFISKPYSDDNTRTMVCEGYAEAFKVLCDAFGLDDNCACIVGTAYTDYNKTMGGLHEWNYVKLFQKWYLVDTTWDDGEDYIDYDYYLAGKKDVGYTGLPINEERVVDSFFNNEECTYKIPSLSSTSYATDTKGKATAKLAFKQKEITKTYGNSDFNNSLTTKTTNGALTYVSSNTKVATVTSSGKVKIKGVGKCKITVYSAITSTYGPASASYKIIVNQASAKLKFADSSLTKKVTSDSFTNKLKATTDGKITYSSSNKKVATVNSSTGKVKLIGVGKVTITAKAAAGKNYKKSSSVSYKLTVKPATPSLSNVTSKRVKKALVNWKKVSCTSYQLQYSTDKNFVKSVKTKTIGPSKISYTISSLSKYKTYYVRIRAYNSGSKLYGNWSSVKKVQIVR